ncbi:MAG: primosomal protein N' [Anaerosomatales bacterium]|nr:primosomal protein N' [Anaerosomatales bacterium]MDT8433439.1 primosomal protein N' [Anaerosomatales bacterium]
MTVARVVLDIPSKELSSAFDYDVPDSLREDAVIGCAVLVEFGSRRAVGHVVAVADSSEVANRKPVIAVLAPPRFDEVAADLARWIAQEYVAPLSDAIRLLLPPGSVPEVVKNDSGWVLKPPPVSAAEERVVEVVEGHHFAPGTNAHRQRAVLDALTTGPVTMGELTAALGSVASTVKRLEQAGAVRVSLRRRFRDPDVRERSAPRHERLSGGQRDALEAIRVAGPGACVLLHGVTGSGKTEVYLRAIAEELARGRSAIVLVPEISLTPQTVGRFRSRFGEQIAVLHSRLSAGERFDQWDRLASGQARVAIGARSALFAPVHDLGLVVMDEEHETSYKQSSAPRYHARDAARRLVAARGAKLVLGSATPSMETLHSCRTGETACVVLDERVGGGTLPEVEVVDMGQEFLNGNRSIFSDGLARELRGVAERNEKAVLLLNRRGFASFLLCRECGHVPGCDRCSTSLTFHESGSLLVCHHCGARSIAPPACPQCGSPYLRRFGAGTQRVAAEVSALVPGLPVVRMDADTTAAKGGHEHRLAEFELLESAVLVGTQMVAKGLDYPEVTLVGVVSADTTLHLPDVRSGERTFQLLEQVAGRAGRGERPGRVIIQTYWPDHPAITAVARHDPSLFYTSEDADRSALTFPPYGRMANIIVTSHSLVDVKACSGHVARALGERVPERWEVLGPVPAPLARVKDRHRWHVLVKAPPGTALPEMVRRALKEVKTPRGVTLAVDIDPLDLA